MIGCHTLRHSYAVHMLEKGYSLHVVKELMGHQSIRTTMAYVKLMSNTPPQVSSPLDDLLN